MVLTGRFSRNISRPINLDQTVVIGVFIQIQFYSTQLQAKAELILNVMLYFLGLLPSLLST